MRLAIGAALCGSILLGTHAFGQSPDATGTWITEDGRAKIKIEHCGDGNKRICGFVAWMKDPLDDEGKPRLDVNNPDPAKRSRPSLGMELMSGLKPDEDGHYAGQIYNAENGKMYSVTVYSDKTDELQVHGCMLKFLCGSQTWTRVADMALPNKVVATAPAAAKPKGPATPGPHAVAPAQ